MRFTPNDGQRTVNILTRNITRKIKSKIKNKKIKNKKIKNKKIKNKKIKTSEICDKRFTRSRNMTTHFCTHTAGKPALVCKICDKRFTESGSLTRHQRVHTRYSLPRCKLNEDLTAIAIAGLMNLKSPGTRFERKFFESGCRCRGIRVAGGDMPSSDLPGEIWKTVIVKDKKVYVSSEGRLIDSRGKKKFPPPSRDGYCYVQICGQPYVMHRPGCKYFHRQKLAPKDVARIRTGDLARSKGRDAM